MTVKHGGNALELARRPTDRLMPGESVDHVDPSHRSIEQMAARFRLFAEAECRGYAPFYEGLCHAIATDVDLLEIARHSNAGQPIPNLFLASVHYLLLAEPGHPLPGALASIESSTEAVEQVFPEYRRFCIGRRERLVNLLSFRRVQTNVVGRCSYLMPAFALVAAHAQSRPLALVDVGASAGLNLSFDRYHYSYSNQLHFGPGDSEVRLNCQIVNGRFPSIPNRFPPVAAKVGIDKAPVDLTDSDARLWSRALIWPEHRERALQFEAAVSVLLRDPPRMVAGDALDVLPTILESVPGGAAACVYHSHTLNQFSQQERVAFRKLLEESSASATVYLVSAEGGNLVVARCDGGSWRTMARANCDSHGRWIEWLEGP